MEAWRSGAKVATTLGTIPGTKPGSKTLGTKPETKPATDARPQNAAFCPPQAPIPNLNIWGWGGWGAGVLVGCTGRRSPTEPKSLRSLVRKLLARLCPTAPKSHFATLPMRKSGTFMTHNTGCYAKG